VTLRSGAHVVVVAPAGIFDDTKLQEGIRLLRDWGYEVSEASHLRSRFRYTAGPADARREDLHRALTGPGIDAVWYARGGYGSVHCLPGLPLIPDERLVIGYSDATSLFCGLQRRERGRGRILHGPVLQSVPQHIGGESRELLRRMLSTGEAPALIGHSLVPGPVVSGPVVGGNLCVLASLVGTPWQLDVRGAILLLEDVGEAPYKLDRLVTQLRAAGCLDGVAGIVLGEFPRCDPPAEADWTLDDLFRDLLAPLNVPVLAGVPVGHAANNHAFWYGARASLLPDRLVFQDAPPARS
jgi:muramoyltetrapeptide carboxypeptidase